MIEDTKVLATYLDGRLVYRAPGNGLVPADDGDEASWWGKRETCMRD